MVYARNIVGLGLASDPFEIVAANRPSTPIFLTRNDAQTNQTQITLNWEMPEDDGGSPILDYTIERNGIVEAIVDSTSFSMYYCTAGEEYLFSVSARNLVGFGPTNVISIISATYP